MQFDDELSWFKEFFIIHQPVFLKRQICVVYKCQFTATFVSTMDLGVTLGSMVRTVVAP